MAGGIKETDPMKLAKQCESFMQGAKVSYEQEKATKGDMWFFEIFHHLQDCADALRTCRALQAARDECERQYQAQVAEVGRLQGALIEIANLDYRGNLPTAQVMARDAISSH